MNDILYAALEYRSLGMACIPVWPESKRPATKWSMFTRVAPTEAHLRRWFRSGRLSLAILCGDVSGGLVVRDFDDRDAYRAWATAFPSISKQLPTVETNRGYHVYCRSDVASVMSASRSGRRVIIPFGDGEMKAGGYVVAPPSVHASGKAYRWIIPLTSRLPTFDLHWTGFASEYLAYA